MDTDFTMARGTDQIFHSRPSTIDIYSLRYGALPRPFLYGLGLNNVEIEFAALYDPALNHELALDRIYRLFDARTAKPLQIRNLFISYAHEDEEFVKALEAALTAAGIRAWRDVHDLTAGRIESQLEVAIRLHPTVLIVLSQNSVDSDWVEWEVTKARDMERERGHDVLCPIALDEAWKESRWSGTLQQQVRKYNILDFSDWHSKYAFDAQFAKLKRGLDLNYRLAISL